MRVLAHDEMELQGSEAEHALQKQRHRARLVPEPARFADVVILVEREALEKHVADRRNRQRDRKQDAEPEETRDCRRRDPTSQPRRRRGEKGQGEQKCDRPRVIAPSTAREAEEDSQRHHADGGDSNERSPRHFQQQVLNDPHDRRDEERAEHIGVLEWAGGALVVVEGEQRTQARDVEIAENA